MSDNKNFVNTKLNILLIGFILGFLAIIYALVRWQFIEHEQFIAIANERYREVKIPAVRGNILASDGTSLAFSEPRFDVYIWKKELEEAEEKNVQTRDEFVRKVSDVLAMKPKKLESILDDDQLWIRLKEKATINERDQLLELTNEEGKELVGLRFEYVNSRNYPENRLGSHVLGFFGYNDYGEPIGVGGLEQFWDRSLQPIEGISNAEVDSFGNPIYLNVQGETEAKPGLTLQTTIDKNLQAILDKKLQDGYKTYQAKSATGIIMDPISGQILALSNFPNFNPNKYNEVDDPEVFGNKTITTPYEIGSVAKVFTVASALELGSIEYDDILLPNGHQGCEPINPEDTYACSSDQVQCICTYDKKPVTESISVIDAMVSSDNIAFKRIGAEMDNKDFRNSLVKFGVGSLTGVDLSGESTGLLPDAEIWKESDKAVFSYGHGYQVTPMQAIAGVATIANQGKRPQPYVVEKVISQDGSVKEFEDSATVDVVSPKVANHTASMMHNVFLNNIPEPRYQELKNYNLSLKSGTALVPYKDRPGYSSEINATYVGFDNTSKKFIMLIKLEEPQVGDLSFYNARMLWLDTFMEIKDYLAIPQISDN